MPIKHDCYDRRRGTPIPRRICVVRNVGTHPYYWAIVVVVVVFVQSALQQGPTAVNGQNITLNAYSCSSGDVLQDTCGYKNDGVCDASSVYCPANSDCFDCDPCRAYDGDTCDACVAAGCEYCQDGLTGSGVCSSSAFAAALPLKCLSSGGTSYTTTCNDNGGGSDQPYSCDILNDACGYTFDLECDAGNLCPSDSDCFDCDPLLDYGFLGCEACISNGGWYCETGLGLPVCSSPDIAAAVPNVCQESGGSEYLSTCGGGDGGGGGDDGGGGGGQLTDDCNFANDACVYANDGACDAGVFCPVNSDCLDCSSCMDHRFNGCDDCTAAGCVWCGADAACMPSGGIDFLTSAFQCKADDFVTTCSANTISDPLIEASDWIFELIKVKQVWAMGISGAGVGIRINDSGVDANHPDISPNFDVDSSCSDYLPVALDAKNSHGTACASLAAAAADNGVCSAGVAPAATLSACRIFDDGGVDFFAFFGYRFLIENIDNVDISSNSYGPETCYVRGERRLQSLECPFSKDNEYSPCTSKSPCTETDWSGSTLSSQCENYVSVYCSLFYESDVQACMAYLDLYVECEYFGQDNQQVEAFVTGVTEGRDGKGIIYIYASGNSYAFGADLSQDGSLNSRFTISVGAVGRDGKHASYSTPGAALLVTAPGGDMESYSNNIVAFPGGGCQDITIGTSFAAPIVAGVVALMLEANPLLTWRDVQGVLAISSQRMDAEDSSWTTNSAGVSHSYLYGFGVVDAATAVAVAQSWMNYSPEQQITGESGTISLAISDYPSDPVSSIIPIDADAAFKTEWATVYLSLSHSSRGDLDVILVSPSGTESILHPGQRPENTQVDERWKLSTVRNWNEPANGDWTLRIVDRRAGDIDPSLSSTSDVLTSWRLIIYGHTGGGGGDPVPTTPVSGTTTPVSGTVSAPVSAPVPSLAPAPIPVFVLGPTNIASWLSNATIAFPNTTLATLAPTLSPASNTTEDGPTSGPSPMMMDDNVTETMAPTSNIPMPATPSSVENASSPTSSPLLKDAGSSSTRLFSKHSYRIPCALGLFILLLF